MKRLMLALVLLTVTPWAAQAYTCGQVRAYVRNHARQDIDAMKQSMTPSQQSEACGCLSAHDQRKAGC